jgi:tetratricopeptide (TPR) repeat protein
LAAVCPACGFINEPGDEFCGGCGARLGAPQLSQPRFTSPDAYTPKHLTEADVEAMEVEVYRALIWLRLGRALWRDGRVEEARGLGTRALSLARERGERGHEAEALCLLGEMLAESAAPLRGPSAEAHLLSALALAGELEMRPLVAHCHLGLGKLYHRTGDRAKAEEHLATAATMYREMDMKFLPGAGGGGDRRERVECHVADTALAGHRWLEPG